MAQEADDMGTGGTASSSPEQADKKERLASLMAAMESNGVDLYALMSDVAKQAGLNPQGRESVSQQCSQVTSGQDGTDRSALDRIFTVAGLAGMDVSEAAFLVMMMATKDMDDDIRLILAEIKAMTRAKQRLRELIRDLNQWISRVMSEICDSKNIDLEKVTGESPNGGLSVNGTAVEYKEPRPDIENSELVAECPTAHDLSGADGVTIQGLRSLLEELKGKLDGMNEMSEMTSLRLQMTMDRRSKFISTLSQMMKKISTTQDLLVQNIK